MLDWSHSAGEEPTTMNATTDLRTAVTAAITPNDYKGREYAIVTHNDTDVLVHLSHPVIDAEDVKTARFLATAVLDVLAGKGINPITGRDAARRMLVVGGAIALTR
jgi:hypothetical protein